jgi:hypothetical protein
MAAGLGFKTFTTGEVLTAADTNGYLMQGVNVFASAAARDAAITSPQEGQFAYLKDTNVTTYYTGSAWANLDTTGMTNPMTTTGDTIYSSSGSTPARLGVGTTGQVLTVAGGLPSWATPATPSAGADWSLFSTTTLTGAQTITVSGISGKDKIMVLVERASSANAASYVGIRLNTSSSNYFSAGYYIVAQSAYASTQFEAYDGGGSEILLGRMGSNAADWLSGSAMITGCNASGNKIFQSVGGGGSTGVNQRFYSLGGRWNDSALITSITAVSSTGNFDAGTMYIYTSA